MSDDELLASLLEAVRGEGAAIARVVALLIEVEDRRLHLELSCPNMFDFCRRHLGFSEDEAYRRKETARLVRRFPQLLDALAERRIHMSALLILRDVLTDENVDTLIKDAFGKTKVQVQWLVAQRAPQPDVASSIRKLPASRETMDAPAPPAAAAAADVASHGERAAAPVIGAAPSPIALSVVPAEPVITPAPPRRIRPSAQVEPLSATRYRVQFTVSAEQLERIERARALTRHGNIEGDLAIIMDQGVALLIAKREKEKLAATARPRVKKKLAADEDKAIRPEALPAATSESATRSIEPVSIPAGLPAARTAPDDSAAPAAAFGSAAPAASAGRVASSRSAAPAVPAATKREVLLRDGERCSFVGSSGERCPARELLELDHRHPRALGGGNEASNLRLLCRAHNQFAAERVFGRDHMSRAIAKRRAKGARTASSSVSAPQPATAPERLRPRQPALPFT